MNIKDFLNYKNSKICKNPFGLMFYSFKKSKILIFNLSLPENLTTFFCFFPILIIWADEKGNIKDLKIVKPFTFNITSKYRNIIEIPLTSKEYQKLRKIKKIRIMDYLPYLLKVNPSI